MKKLIFGILLMVSATPSYAQCDYSVVKFNYKNDCGRVSFNLGSEDTCLIYITWAQNLRTKNFLRLSDYRVFSAVLDTGLYLFKVDLFCKCAVDNGGMIYKNAYIGCDSGTVSINNLSKTEPKLVSICDLLGRPVEKVEDNIPYIFLYENGQRKKIIRNK